MRVFLIGKPREPSPHYGFIMPGTNIMLPTGNCEIDFSFSFGNG